MKVITLLNEKGGVGKTTLAQTIASGLAIRGHRVILIDADPQANLTIGLGFEPSPGFYDLLIRNVRFDAVTKIVPPEMYKLPEVPVKGELFLIPGNHETRMIGGNTDNPSVIDHRIKQLKDDVDAVLFDTSPTPSLLHGAIYMATDYMILPTMCEAYSFRGLGNTLMYRDNYSKLRMERAGRVIEILGIVPNMVRNTIEHREKLSALRDQFGAFVWEPIPMSILWGEASGFTRSIFNYVPESNAAKVAWKIVERVERVIDNEKTS